MARSIIAVLIGFLVIGVLSVGADTVLRALNPGVFDANGRVDSVSVLLLMQLYVAVFAISGCYLTARLAPSHPMRHALTLGALGLVLNIVGAIVMRASAPLWYHVLAVALVMPLAWTGGWLREYQLARQPPR